jgi:2-polyprenyl-6-methoxyphenol hydroxylase-like FAD-dependent oxidoreductase
VHVTIIGGGIGGLTLANALHRVGIGFDLYERAPALTEVGAAIGLTTAVQRLFHAIGLGDELRARCTPVNYVCLADRQLRLRRRIRAAGEALVIHRADLIAVLASGVPAERIHLSRTAVDVDSAPAGAAISFDDGSTVEAECLVAADGIQSAVRRALFPELAIRYIDQTIWRGITPTAVPEQLADSYYEIWGRGLRYLTVPGDGVVYWLAVQKAPPGGRDNPETVREDLVRLFKDFHPLLKGLIRESGSIIRNDMADLGPRSRPWHHHRVGFLGDAIHATTPNLAQGGCQAIEDGVCLALCLAKHRDDPPAAFRRYQQLREKKVMSIVRTSWSFGKAAHSRNPFVHYLYRALLERSPAALIRRQEKMLNDLDYLRAVDPGGLVPPAG